MFWHLTFKKEILAKLLFFTGPEPTCLGCGLGVGFILIVQQISRKILQFVMQPLNFAQALSVNLVKFEDDCQLC